MAKTLALIGSGMIGGTLARLAVSAGLSVALSNSRGPQTLDALVAELGERAAAVTVEEAARIGDLVVAAVPLSAHDRLPAAALAGKTVIDTTNYYPDRDGRIEALDSHELTAGELVQRHLPDAHVVKAFNNIVFRQLDGLARPSGAAERSALPVAGDDPAAKAQVVRLLDALGYDALDIGTLADSWRSEPDSPVYVRPYQGAPPQGLDQEQTLRWMFETEGTPVPVERVKELVDSAVAPQGARPAV